MKISIITPSFNQADYVSTCLASVSGQIYANIEHIVVDGGSTDRTIELLKEFKQKDSRLIYSSAPDEGQGDAVNKGFLNATGDIIAWINSDDYYFDESVFEHVVGLFKSNPDIDIIYGGMAYVDSCDKLHHVRIPPKYNYDLLTRIAYIGNTNAFYRRKVIERHLLDKNYHFVIDHEFMLRITKDFKALRTQKVLACFRVHSNAKTQVMSKKSKDIERIRRNEYHGIRTNLYYRILLYRDRIIYRLRNLYNDYKYLSAVKENPPFKKFITR